MSHPYRDVAICAVKNTRQARVLEGYTADTLGLEAATGVLELAGVEAAEVDGVFGDCSAYLIWALGLGPTWVSFNHTGIGAVLEAAATIAAHHCETVIVCGSSAGSYVDRSATAPWTRPNNEFIGPFGMFTALEFALIARRHMEMFGTRPEHLATVAATIRNNGHINPDAVFSGRGPYTAADVLESRMIADPFHLLDCSITSEGAVALLLTSADRARDLPLSPAYILGGGIDSFGAGYRVPPSWDLRGHGEDPNGWVGRRAARRAFAMAGLQPDDVDVAELYDPFSFEIIRQLEAFGFCEPGEGAEFVMEGNIAPDGTLPITTDGGMLSYSHGGGSVQLLQRVSRAVEQLQGVCSTTQIPGVEVAMSSNFGAGALTSAVMLLGTDQP